MLEYVFDKSLNLNEKGLLTILLNIPENFEITIRNLQALSSNSKYMTKRTLQTLKKKGYLKVAQISPVGENFQYRYEPFITPQIELTMGETQSIKQEILSHKTPAMTSRYKHFMSEYKRPAINNNA